MCVYVCVCMCVCARMPMHACIRACMSWWQIRKRRRGKKLKLQNVLGEINMMFCILNI